MAAIVPNCFIRLFWAGTARRRLNRCKLITNLYTLRPGWNVKKTTQIPFGGKVFFREKIRVAEGVES